jgi:hypothetical protein
MAEKIIKVPGEIKRRAVSELQRSWLPTRLVATDFLFARKSHFDESDPMNPSYYGWEQIKGQPATEKNPWYRNFLFFRAEKRTPEAKARRLAAKTVNKRLRFSDAEAVRNAVGKLKTAERGRPFYDEPPEPGYAQAAAKIVEEATVNFQRVVSEAGLIPKKADQLLVRAIYEELLKKF